MKTVQSSSTPAPVFNIIDTLTESYFITPNLFRDIISLIFVLFSMTFFKFSSTGVVNLVKLKFFETFYGMEYSKWLAVYI